MNSLQIHPHLTLGSAAHLSWRSVSMLAVLTLASACSKPTAPPAASRAAAALPEVGVITVASTSVTLTKELPGRTSAYRVAEVRARVNGIILKRLFQEGSEVKEGQPLFLIDAAPYRAALASAQAQLARAEANLASTRLQAARFKELVAANAVSKQEYDNAIASQKAYEADVAAGKAAVETASINLGYTTVRSPLTGRIGRSAVTEGAYAQQGQATLLATVQQLDPIYIDLTQSSAEVAQLRHELETGRLQSAGKAGAKVQVILEDGRNYGRTGVLQFSDVTVDPGTGAITLRAIVPNPKRELLPGMFVRARLEEGVDPNALLVPQAGITRDTRGDALAMVVGEGNKVEARPVQADKAMGGAWLVSRGLKAGDRVIVDGLMKIRPGMPVSPVPAATTPATNTPSAESPATAR